MKVSFNHFKKIPVVNLLTLITTLCSIAGLYLIFLGVQTLEETKNANQGNFILSLNRDFYTNDKLNAIRKSMDNGKTLFKSNGGDFDTEDVDSYIGFFATLNGLIDRNILDYDLVDANFGYYIKQSYDNNEIQNYVKYLQKNYGKDVDQDFLDLGSKISKEGY